ncbi:MAG: M43 family zinc metalloprotease [Fluviicola sp.]
MKRKLLSLSLGLFGLSSLFAQELDGVCGAYTAQEQLFNDYPELREQYEAYRLLENSMVQSNVNGKSSVSYEVPVVFHIIHEYGNELISDAQVYDAMEVINREFNAADPDSVDLVPEYQNLNGNARITFKLAAKDPFGNCTNGIEHIYSHETRVGDAYSKLNQWNRSRYLNIWVVDIVGVPGAAAYATFPASTDGSGFWVDGVLSAHNYIGTIGTGSPGVQSVITHEIGHWLGLAHTFGNSDLINNGPTICNDDGIADTPPTRGHQNCNYIYPTEWIDCDTTNGGVVEDLQNYMDYSYCYRHFTPGQCTAMNNTLEGIAGQRNNLWTDSTLILTGVQDLQVPQDPNNELTVPLCSPVADFFASRTTACAGTPITFTDVSWNAVVDSRTWTFEDGTPATSTSGVANVSFSGSGWKEVTLTVTNAAGTDTRTETDYIYISGDWAEANGPTTFDMESETAAGTGTNFFLVQNPEDNYGKFGVVSDYGYNGSKAWKLQTYFDNSQSDPFTDAGFYNQRLGLSMDHLITPAIDLRYTSNVSVTFKYAYATNATNSNDITENLRVFTSSNCGENWTPRIITVDGTTVGSTLTGNDLITAGYAGYTDFAPTNNGMWKEATVTFNTTSNDNKTRLRFAFEASDYASNLFIDDIQINGTLNIEDMYVKDMEINVYPNPNQGESISVSYYAQNHPVTFTLRDAQGKTISVEKNNATNSAVTHQISASSNLSAGYYLLEIQSGDHNVVKKVVVM